MMRSTAWHEVQAETVRRRERYCSSAEYAAPTCGLCQVVRVDVGLQDRTLDERLIIMQKHHLNRNL